MTARELNFWVGGIIVGGGMTVLLLWLHGSLS
jgi:hypothetical protein